MKKFALTVVAIIVVAAGGYGAWYVLQQQQNVTVVFSDGHGLKPGAEVWMSGVKIGKVKGIKITRDGVETVLNLDSNVRRQLTDKALFVIHPGFENGDVPVVMVKPGAPGGIPLRKNARIRGVNSYPLWLLTEIPKKLKEFENEPQVREGMRQLEKFRDKLEKKQSGQ